MKLLLNVDWLTLNCHARYLGDDLDLKTFLGVKKEYGTKVFKEVWTIKRGNTDYATITRKPYSSILERDFAQIKFSNFLLYTPDFVNTATQLLKELHFEVFGISRFDICGDFRKLVSYEKPEELIKDYFCEKIVRNGGGKWQSHGTQKKLLKYEQLKFGSPESSVKAYMYNKSQELRAVKDKPYIRHLWKINGFFNDNFRGDIWRCEFSCDSDVKEILSVITGEEFSIEWNKFFTHDFKKMVFFALQQKYFKFKWKKEGDKNKSRWEDVKLFSGEITDFKRVLQYNLGDSKRADKIFIKKYEATILELIQLDYPEEDIQKLKVFLLNYIQGKDLFEWYKEKCDNLLFREVEQAEKEEEAFLQEWAFKQKLGFEPDLHLNHKDIISKS